MTPNDWKRIAIITDVLNEEFPDFDADAIDRIALRIMKELSL